MHRHWAQYFLGMYATQNIATIYESANMLVTKKIFEPNFSTHATYTQLFHKISIYLHAAER